MTEPIIEVPAVCRERSQAAIAARIGYADPFAFSRVFCRHEGRWPSSLRRRP